MFFLEKSSPRARLKGIRTIPHTYYWRASLASETLTGVTQSKNRGCLFIYLLASERSERDTIRGNSIEISLYLLASERSERDTYRGKNEKIGDVCLYIWTYVCHFVL